MKRVVPSRERPSNAYLDNSTLGARLCLAILTFGNILRRIDGLGIGDFHFTSDDCS